MEIKNLTFSYLNSGNLFENLSLTIEHRKITVFLGPSGCGKSTLLRILAGLQRVNQKAYCYEDLKAGFVFQEANLLTWWNSKKNIMLPFRLKSHKINSDYFDELVSLLNISDCLLKFPHELSGGQKMRVSIARALITQPQFLFMDEPFSALDEPTRLNLQDELKQIQQRFGMTILFVTHSFYEAAFLGERVFILSSKKPVNIVYDKNNSTGFSDRFEPAYQEKVKEISRYFSTPNRKNEIF